mmetsp:Transcript_1780/g.5054  ORF Transcript_1780/g.5054 Transcript_1780/m.5054 type:complete len:247 (-) Transcript_1780:381-1121(-)
MCVDYLSVEGLDSVDAMRGAQPPYEHPHEHPPPCCVPQIKRWREASAAAGIDVLSTNPFARFRLPPQRAAFFEAVKKYPPGAQEITVALVHRAMATYPMAKGLADEREGIISTYHHGMCSDELYNNFKRTEDMINREVQEVQFAADEINPGWGRSIWAEVAQHHRQIMARRQAEMMQANKRAEIERQVKLARNKQKNTQANSAQEAAKAERDAERAAAQLLKEEEASSKKATPTATKSGGKKKKKR